LRSLLLIAIASVVLGGSAGASLGGGNTQRIVDLLTGIFQDVGTIANSFAGGPNDPRNPVNSSAVLNQDRAQMDDATDKARLLAGELQQRYLASSDSGK
jgi:hypothetical protein